MYSPSSASQASLPSSSSSQSYLSPPPSPAQPRKPAQPIRLQPIGVDPARLVGKVLTRIRRSPVHPSVTLDFADHTTFQVRVDGYDPAHRGVPKELETNAALHALVPGAAPRDVRLTVTHARLVGVRDTAHDLRAASAGRWIVEHLALALRFAEPEADGWHCVWATMAEYDGRFGPCLFRSFDDVYLDEITASPSAPRTHRGRGRGRSRKQARTTARA